MEELPDGIFKLIFHILLGLVRLMLWLVSEVSTTVLWYAGWPVTRLFSLGRQPKQGITDHDRERPVTLISVMGVGLVSLSLMAYTLMAYLE